ncbi:hypothetical protein D3C87_189700 [compost metagenome]
MSIDKEIVKDFVTESKNLIHQALELLESIEGDSSQAQELEAYGNSVDRIMGGAKSLALLAPPTHSLHMISDYSALCKAVGYKASQIKNNPQFYDVCVALLLDATETLEALIDRVDETSDVLKKTLPQAFIERVRWVSNQFSSEYRGSVDSTGSKTMNQSEIDDLMKKLGL